VTFTPEELLALAERALDRLDWGQVYALASDVLTLDPGNAEAITLRGLAERHGGRSSLPGRRQATALFADLVGSTPLAERYDVEIYSNVLRAFEQACRPAIDRHEGHLVDVQGDGIVACFGYPDAHEDDACRAVSAALDMLAGLRPVAAELKAESGIELQARIGIDTGVMVIDGAGIRGASLNRAARLQAVATPGTVLLSATTNELVGERFETQLLGQRELKGIEAPVEVFQVIGPRDRARQAPAPGARPLPLIGRDAELQLVLDLWDRTMGAREVGDGSIRPTGGAMVLITGEPGIGKSRLASAIVERTAEDGAQSIELYCSSYGVASSLSPVRTAIERYTDMSLDDSNAERVAKLEGAFADLGVDLAEIIPALGVLLDLHLADRYPGVELAPVQLREFLLERLVALLRALASKGPVVMVLEDLHWADPTTLELLDHMIDAGLPAGLLVLATARTDLQWAPRPEQAITIHLDPLPELRARELALAAAPGRLSEADAREIAARGDGVPLFVEQLAHAFSSGGSALREGNDAVPRTLTQLLQARLDAVGPSKLVAQVAATIGREFDTSVLEDVMANLVAARTLDADVGALEHHLNRLVDAQLIEPMNHDGLLRFHHALMRDAAYQSQLIGDRSARHLAAAQVLAEAKVADPALTAFHFDRAGRPLDALGYYLQAVARAKAAGSFAEALAHLGRCEALLAAVADETVRAQFELAVRLNRGLAVSSTAGYAAPPVVEDYRRARDLCEALRDVPGIGAELLKALFGLWAYYFVGGDLDSARNLSSAIERQLDRTPMRAGRPSLDACRGVEAFYGGDLVQARELLSRAVAGLTDDDVDLTAWPLPNDPLAAAYAFLGPLRFLTGDVAGAFEAVRSGRARSESLPFPIGPFSAAFVCNYQSALHRAMGDGLRAAAAAGEVIRIGERHGFLEWQMVGRMQLAAANVMTGPSTEALDEMDEAIATWSAVGGELLIPWLRVEQARGYLGRGDLGKAVACLDQAFAIMERGQRLSLPEALRLRAELRVRADPAATPDADADLREAIEVARTQGAVYSLLRAALSHRRLLGVEGDHLVDTALAESVAAYGDATGFPDLEAARALLTLERRRVRPG
jgi:class 3 adenylate cyclase/tetratricopeptide (TPR) repeat protein